MWEFEQIWKICDMVGRFGGVDSFLTSRFCLCCLSPTGLNGKMFKMFELFKLVVGSILMTGKNKIKSK